MRISSLRRAFLGVLLGAGFLCATPVHAQSRDVVLITYAGPISPVSAEYIDRGIAEGEARGAAAVVLQLDTPGGLDTSMRQIIQREMNAHVPVVVFVAPRGARAASAGCLIVLAADVAVMAPGTNIGAAHPVDLSGGPLSEKIVNDAAAYARSLATAHHRNADWAERAVRQSVSVPEEEALSLGIIDLTANDLSDLLIKLNGRVAHAAAGDKTLSLAGAREVALEMSTRERLLATLTHPTVAYLLLLLGVLAIVVEIVAPHGFVTGTAGVVAVLLALAGLANLPVQLSGAALLVLGMVLLGLELKITSHGVLTLIGLAAFVFGSLLLFPRVPGYRVSLWAIGSVALLWAGMLGAVLRVVIKARRRPVITGTQRLVGGFGTAKTNLAPRGVVLLAGEDWDARADPPPVSRGEKVQVLAVEGLTLRVRKVS
jgi:membrane-bound serine protease (ClpP class)